MEDLIFSIIVFGFRILVINYHYLMMHRIPEFLIVTFKKPNRQPHRCSQFLRRKRLKSALIHPSLSKNMCSSIERSSSLGEVSLSNEVFSQEPKTVNFFEGNCNSSVGPRSESVKKVEFTIGLEPGNQGCKKQPSERFGEFLRACYLCNKKLEEGQKVYMYGYLGAFCTISCQEDQMALDGFHQEIKKETAQMHSKGILLKWQHKGAY